MPVVTLFNGSYCHGEDVARKVVESLGYRTMDDQSLIREASGRFRVDEEKLHAALTRKPSIFNKFTHEKERSLAFLKVVLADQLRQDDFLLLGFSGHLIPRKIAHVLKVCVIADVGYRAREAARLEGLSEKEAIKKIYKDDEKCVLWMEYVHGQKDPWLASLYDIVAPVDKSGVDGAAGLVCANVGKDVLQVTPSSQAAVEDFALAAQVDLKLALEGHCFPTSASSGVVTVVINKNVLMLSSLEEELKKTVGAVPGVKSVEAKVGPGYYKTDIYRRYDFEMSLPSKVLLVDDEREFAQTLSERLQMRDVPSAVVFDGEAALSLVEEEEPEVMVLDLKMPGVDGLEVLRRVKTDHPNVEVIVLTGHGSKDVERLCMEMGACAYLEKPVDIDTLTRTMKDAYEKMRQKKTRVSPAK